MLIDHNVYSNKIIIVCLWTLSANSSMVLCNEDLRLKNFAVNGPKNGSAKSYCEKCLYDRSAEKKKYCESSSDSLVLKLAGGLDMKKLATTTLAPIEYVTL